MGNYDDLEEDEGSLHFVEEQALQEFDTDESGDWECRKILNDWFVKLRERVGDDETRYRADVWDAVEVLSDIRGAMTAAYLGNGEEGNKSRLWVWPSSGAFRNPPKNWLARSPVNCSILDEALTKYLKRPWLQHDIIDGSVINALLFTELAELSEEVRIGTATGRPDWSYILSYGNASVQLALSIVLPIFGFLVRWVLLPAVAIGLIIYGFQTSAIVVTGLWSLYVLYCLVMIPARWRQRKLRREIAVKADEVTHTMLHAWMAASGSTTINPTRLKEMVKAAEERGYVFTPVLHTLLDRAIRRDPTALVTEWE